MAITVIPAYRVVTKFARQAQGLPFEESVNSLEQNLRDYVRNLLSMLHPSFMELGERSAVTQLGDPDPDSLVEALGELEAGSPKVIVEGALARCVQSLPRPDLSARVFLLPGDGESRVLVRQMNGALGFSLGSQAMMVFLWPVQGWQRWLTYTVTHEYIHLVRNLLFPRGLSGNKLVYMKTQEPETLLDVLVAEGLADVFATRLLQDTRPPWTDALAPEVEGRLWARVHRRLNVSDTTEIRRILFGDNDRIPMWTGYTIGYRIVERYLKTSPDAQPANLVGVLASAIFEASAYQPAS
ncbi:MAG: DUF2268 domain-containing protein [Dehalococcoidia bacterium]